MNDAEEKKINRCDVCENNTVSKNQLPCSRCRDNAMLTSHYKPSKIFLKLQEVGAIKEDLTV